MHPPRSLLTAARHLVAALLLIMVAAHAVTPHNAPLARNKGSAFSAATADVSLKSGGKAVVVQQIAQAEPPLPPRAESNLYAMAALPADISVAGRSHQARAPPAAATTFAPLAPRAPPAA